MKLLYPSAKLAPYCLRAMTTVARASVTGIGKPERAILDAAQRLLLHTELDIDALPPISPEELAAHFQDPALARQLVQGMVVMSLADGPASRMQIEVISGFAAGLGVDEPAVKVIERLTERDLLLFRLDFYRRSHLRDYVESQYRTQGGILGVAKALLTAKGLIEDKDLASRFRALGELAEDSLGHGFFQFHKDNGFAFPGEKGGFPVGAVFHDFGHVLGGYPATPEGEMRVAAFQAGYRRSENAFFTILFAVLIHTAGVNMAPMEMPVLLGRIGEGKLFEEMLIALERGGSMNTDLGDDWDFWPYVGLPLQEARERLGVPPLPQADPVGEPAT